MQFAPRNATSTRRLVLDKTFVGAAWLTIALFARLAPAESPASPSVIATPPVVAPPASTSRAVKSDAPPAPVAPVAPDASGGPETKDSTAGASSPGEPGADAPAEFRKLVAALDERLTTTAYSDRLTACEDLLTRPEAAQALLVLARDGSPEAAHRALDIVSVLYPKSEGAQFDDLDDALQQLASDGPASLAARAGELLTVHQPVREQQALAQIQRMGGLLTYANPRGILGFEPGQNLVQAIAVSRNWTGGDEGLRYFRRIPTLRTIYDVKGNSITAQGWADLSASLPDVDIIKRGAARLGIEGRNYTPSGCQIEGIQEKSSAANAGLQRGDVIYAFDQQPVADFESLIELIATKAPGDRVTLSIERQGTPLEVELELQGWN